MKPFILSVLFLASSTLVAQDSYWYTKGETFGIAVAQALTNTYADPYNDQESEDLLVAIFRRQDYDTKEYKERYDHFKAFLAGAKQSLSSFEPEKELESFQEEAFNTLITLLCTFASSFIESTNPVEAVLFISKYVDFINDIKHQLQVLVPHVKEHTVVEVTPPSASYVKESMIGGVTLTLILGYLFLQMA